MVETYTLDRIRELQKAGALIAAELAGCSGKRATMLIEQNKIADV